MEVAVQAGQLGAVAADAVVVNLFQGVTQPGGATGAIDRATGGAITRLIAAGDFTGRLNQTAVLYPAPDRRDGAAGGVAAPRVIVVGLGKRDELTLDRVRQVAATAARRAQALRARALTTVLHG